jgi:hypothetical protein
VVRLGLVGKGNEEHFAVVITHDCDLPHKAEQSVEVIVADKVVRSPMPDPQLSYAKNPRKIHLIYEESGGSTLILELQHNNRCSIQKADFAKHAIKDDNLTLPDMEKRTLKQWLAARYGRVAFPDEFEKRLRRLDGKYNVVQRIGKILESESKYLVGLFFNLGEQRGIEVIEGDPYALSVSVVYDSIEGGSQARLAAEDIASQLRELFERVYSKADVATELAIDACEAVADTEITLADLRRVDQWRLEYVSLQDDDQGNFLSLGETPV